MYKVVRQFSKKVGWPPLSGAESLLQQEASVMAAAHLAPHAHAQDRSGEFPSKQLEAVESAGMLRVCLSPESGGRGGSLMGLSVVITELGAACASTAAATAIHNCLYSCLLEARGTALQRTRFLAADRPHKLGCFALTEPEAGSDAGALSCAARASGRGWLLSGVKSWVTSARYAENMIVFANVDKSRKQRGITGFIVPMDSPGVTLSPDEELMGIRALSCCSVTLQDVYVDEEQGGVLGQVGEGYSIAMKQLDTARVGIASLAVGIAQSCLDVAACYSLRRVAFGRPLAHVSAVQSRLCDMRLQVDAARLLTWRAAVHPTRAHAAAAKVTAAQAAVACAHHAVQILGANGYSQKYPAERLYRDARGTEIYGGVTDIQKMIVAQELIKEYIREGDQQYSTV